LAPPYRPSRQQQQQQSSSSNSSIQELAELQDNSRDLLELLRSLRQRIHSLQEVVEGANQLPFHNNSGGGDWQLDMLPPEAWDPQAGGVSLLRSRPVAAEYLANIPRIVLNQNSSLFHEVILRLHTITTTTTTTRAESSRLLPPPPLEEEASSSSSTPSSSLSSGVILHPVMGEFGPSAASSSSAKAQTCLHGVPLIVAEPKTGIGGDLSATTKLQIQQVLHVQRQLDGASTTTNSSTATAPACIVYMERGGNITFVQKAMMAQRAGASAVIIGNNTDVTWPYIMKDTAGEAALLGLKIPVVMVQQRDAKIILQHYRQSSTACLLVSLEMTSLHRHHHHHHGDHDQQQQQAQECVVCREVFEVEQTVMRLPSCGHVFHEPCAMAWLTRNHTCPFCRGEMPTEGGDGHDSFHAGGDNHRRASAARPPPPPPLGTSQHRSSHSIEDLYR
jgi:hypothetical protein